MFLKITFNGKIKKVKFRDFYRKWNNFHPAIREILQINNDQEISIHFFDHEHEKIFISGDVDLEYFIDSQFENQFSEIIVEIIETINQQNELQNISINNEEKQEEVKPIIEIEEETFIQQEFIETQENEEQTKTLNQQEYKEDKSDQIELVKESQECHDSFLQLHNDQQEIIQKQEQIDKEFINIDPNQENQSFKKDQQKFQLEEVINDLKDKYKENDIYESHETPQQLPPSKKQRKHKKSKLKKKILEDLLEQNKLFQQTLQRNESLIQEQAQKLQDIQNEKNNLDLLQENESLKLKQNEMQEELLKMQNKLESKLGEQSEIITQLKTQIEKQSHEMLQSDVSRVENIDSSCMSFEIDGFVKKEDFLKLNESFAQMITDMNQIKNNMDLMQKDHSFLLNSSLNKSTIHWGTKCVNCQTQPIEGRIYKCLLCESFTLCSQCESKDFHSHPLIRVTDTEQKELEQHLASKALDFQKKSKYEKQNQNILTESINECKISENEKQKINLLDFLWGQPKNEAQKVVRIEFIKKYKNFTYEDFYKVSLSHQKMMNPKQQLIKTINQILKYQIPQFCISYIKNQLLLIPSIINHLCINISNHILINFYHINYFLILSLLSFYQCFEFINSFLIEFTLNFFMQSFKCFQILFISLQYQNILTQYQQVVFYLQQKSYFVFYIKRIVCIVSEILQHYSVLIDLHKILLQIFVFKQFTFCLSHIIKNL